ncbi:patatin-like phospholipase family protein [Limnoraphis robusta Tam1]|uniref:patatin-like phospholipase family protein n=1 Tax=Limnoraphis robusta TaxID=1118279 RepID=UPI002B21F5B6|nr:patatin-like phospholipase family protein [Limnoraphis robusta]MEA5501119.1 patatin-like phospholipase family protein [Limnoraphis robusta BA-68 BA1]MEA5542014.1 patatin-like phospholipase family protein [Limnoraphis robusta Tam1]
MIENFLNSQWGLVLTGGGAKGAYQAGALRYLAELNFQPKIIAGTSVGALNGAVLASYRPFSNAVQQLNELWTNLGEVEILKANTEQIYHLLSYAAQTFIPTFREWMLHFLVESGILKDRTAFYDPTPIEYLVRETINPVELRRGIELWVTVFPSLKIPGLGYDWLIDFIRAKMGTGAEWLCIQDCRDHETVYNLLLASVAIPLAFPCRSVNGKNYVDGGLVDNVPLGALAARGCTHVIVIHLGSGRVWNRHDFPHQTIIEIRPQKLLNSDLQSLLNFDADRISELKQQGYEDAKSQLEPIFKGFRSLSRLSQTQDYLISSTVELLEDEPLF